MEVDLFGLRAGGAQDGVAIGTIIELAPGSITVRLDDRLDEVTVGPSRLVNAAA